MFFVFIILFRDTKLNQNSVLSLLTELHYMDLLWICRTTTTQQAPASVVFVLLLLVFTVKH